jgi:predicted transposase YdaD
VDEFDKKAVTPLDEWIAFLKTGDIPDKPKAKGLLEAKESLLISQLSKAEQRAYDAHYEAVRYQRSVIQTGVIEGRYEGIAEGRAEGIVEGRIKGIAEGRAEGIAEGRIKGIAEGRMEGIAEGRMEGIAEGRVEGIAEGRVEGIAEGRAKGRMEGIAEGEKSQSLSVARNALKIGMEKETIIKLTGLSIEDLADL